MPEPFDTWSSSRPDAVRADLIALDARIRAVAPDLAVGIDGSMLGYGPFRYRYASGREGDAFLFSVAVRKSGFSLYVNAVDDGSYLAERAGARLGKVSVGRSCIRFRRFADLDGAVLDEVLARALVVGGTSAVVD